jgi:uncharacterized protein (TIGR02145 family)
MKNGIFFLVLLFIAFSCRKEESYEVMLTSVTEVHGTHAKFSGSYSKNSDFDPIQRGFCWSTDSNPTVDGPHVIATSGGTNFSMQVTVLQGETTYYVRAYVRSHKGIHYSEQVQFNTIKAFVQGEGVQDVDGNHYETIIFPNGQEWLSSNLHATRFSNGDPIPNVQESSLWSTLNTGAWSENSDEESPEVNGYYYNYWVIWDERNVCPSGWHIPSSQEWYSLLVEIDPLTLNNATHPGLSSFYAGVTLKSTLGWGPDVVANNSSGMTILPAGRRLPSGSYDVSKAGIAAQTDNFGNLYYFLVDSKNEVGFQAGDPKSGVKIRCVRDE